MKNMRGDRQLEKYIERDGNAVKGVELLSEIAEMDSIVTVMSTAFGVENMFINLYVDPINHPGMIFYELDDGRTPQEEALKVLKTIAVLFKEYKPAAFFNIFAFIFLCLALVGVLSSCNLKGLNVDEAKTNLEAAGCLYSC